MYSTRHGLPCWEQYLINRFDLEHVSVAAKNGSSAMLYDPMRDVGLAVWFDEHGAHLQLGGELWSGYESGSITSSMIHGAQERDLTNGRLERISTTQERRLEVLRAIFDGGEDDLLDGWIDQFGHETITQLGAADPAPTPI